MTRERIPVGEGIERLEILDKDGGIDTDLDPKLDDETLLALHRHMLRGRRFDARLLTLQRSGRIGTFAPGEGQEASQIGSALALGPEDWVVPSYREDAVLLALGIPMEGLFLYIAGYNEGGAIPEDKNLLPIAIPVGSQPLHAAGIAYGMRRRGAKAAAIAYFGDGATSQGDFHEAMNFAAVFKLPTVFLCQNNQWAISVPLKQQMASKTIAQKALAYGVPGIQVDGNDVLAVHAATREALQRAYDGEGPTLIECVTYRMGVHTTADDPTKYREDAEVEDWTERDPIARFETYLKGRDLISDEEIERLGEEIDEEISNAWTVAQDRFEELDDDPEHMFENLYEEMPPYLRDQKEAFADGVDQPWRGGADE